MRRSERATASRSPARGPPRPCPRKAESRPGSGRRRRSPGRAPGPARGTAGRPATRAATLPTSPRPARSARAGTRPIAKSFSDCTPSSVFASSNPASGSSVDPASTRPSPRGTRYRLPSMTTRDRTGRSGRNRTICPRTGRTPGFRPSGASTSSAHAPAATTTCPAVPGVRSVQRNGVCGRNRTPSRPQAAMMPGGARGCGPGPSPGTGRPAVTAESVRARPSGVRPPSGCRTRSVRPARVRAGRRLRAGRTRSRRTGGSRCRRRSLPAAAAENFREHAHADRPQSVERVGRVVRVPGRENAGPGPRRLPAEVAAVDEFDGQPGFGQGVCGRQPDDPAAHDQHVRARHCEPNSTNPAAAAAAAATAASTHGVMAAAGPGLPAGGRATRAAPSGTGW